MAVGVVQVWDGALEELQVELSQLNQKARRLGIPPIHVEVMDAEEVPERRSAGEVQKHTRYTVKLIGSPPREAGWEFCASIDHTPVGIILYQIPGSSEVDLQGYYESAAGWCDHCHSDHERSCTFILLNRDKGLKRVGRGCVAEFLGHVDAEQLMAELTHVHAALLALGRTALRQTRLVGDQSMGCS